MTDYTMSNDPDSTAQVATVHDEQQFNDLADSTSVLLVDFYTDWCGACELMDPIVTDLAAEHDIPIAKINAEELRHVAGTYDVRAVPTILVFEDGTPSERFVGMHDKKELAAAVQ